MCLFLFVPLLHARSVGFPWQPKLIGEGVMEREYMSFLTEHLVS
jgi:hypothetical protein